MVSTNEIKKRPLQAIDPNSPAIDIDSEKAVIGSVLRDCETLILARQYITPEDFSDDWCSKLFRIFCECGDKRKRIDPTLIIETVRAQKIDPSFMFECLECAPFAFHAAFYANNVRKASILRQIHAMNSNAAEGIMQRLDPEVILGTIDSEVGKLIGKCANSTAASISEAISESLDEIGKRLAGESQATCQTGYPALDDMVGGMRPGKLIILAGRPSMGKSAFAMNICENVASRDEEVLYVSLEMTRGELAERILSSQARVDSKKMRDGTMTTIERQRIVEAASNISRWTLRTLDDSHLSIRQFAARAAQTKRKSGLALVVVDYLQLVDPSDARAPRQEQVAQMSRNLKVLARELEVPVIVVAQLNRQTESASDNRPRLSHLRESGAIEQDADIVWFVHREEYYVQDEKRKNELKGKAELIVSKNRGGPTGTVPLTWIGAFTRFETAADERRYEAPSPNVDIAHWNESEGFFR